MSMNPEGERIHANRHNFQMASDLVAQASDISRQNSPDLEQTPAFFSSFLNNNKVIVSLDAWENTETHDSFVCFSFLTLDLDTKVTDKEYILTLEGVHVIEDDGSTKPLEDQGLINEIGQIIQRLHAENFWEEG